jgi:hypothetical protein
LDYSIVGVFWTIIGVIWTLKFSNGV